MQAKLPLCPTAATALAGGAACLGAVQDLCCCKGANMTDVAEGDSDGVGNAGIAEVHIEIHVSLLEGI